MKKNAKEIWEKLIAPHAPREEGDAYIVDESSSGIYTPVLEGAFTMNPRGPTAKSYLEAANKKIAEGDTFSSSGSKPLAYKSYLIAMSLLNAGNAIAFRANVKRLTPNERKVLSKSKKIDDPTLIAAFSDKEIFNRMSDLSVKISEVRKDLPEHWLTIDELVGSKAPEKIVRKKGRPRIGNDKISIAKRIVKKYSPEEVQGILDEIKKMAELETDEKKRTSNALDRAGEVFKAAKAGGVEDQLASALMLGDVFKQLPEDKKKEVNLRLRKLRSEIKKREETKEKLGPLFSGL